MCYHTHSSPNESIDFAVLRCTQSIDSFGKNGDIFSICTIYIFQTFFGTFPMTFLQKFSNQKVQFSIEINNIPKKLFEKSVRNLSIHLKLLMHLAFFFFMLHDKESEFWCYLAGGKNSRFSIRFPCPAMVIFFCKRVLASQQKCIIGSYVMDHKTFHSIQLQSE